MAAVSDLALIILAAPEASFDHEGSRPQRTSGNSRRGCVGFWQMTGTGWVAAMLSRGAHSSAPGNGVEIFVDQLLFPRQSIAPAHLLAFDLARASVLGELLAKAFLRLRCSFESVQWHFEVPAAARADRDGWHRRRIPAWVR